MRFLLAIIFLAGCQSPQPSTIVQCPPIRPYTDAEQDAVADEIDQRVKDGIFTELDQWIIDYGDLRDRIRACKSTPAVN